MRRTSAGGSSVRVVAQCRGEGLGYVALATAGEEPCGTLRAAARLTDGTRVACAIYSVDSATLRQTLAPGASWVWVVVVPLLSTDLVVEVFDDNNTRVLDTVFRALVSKVRSRALATTRPAVAAALRGYERAYGHGATQVRIQQVWPGNDGCVVWRVRVEFAVARRYEAPHLRVFDAQARALDVPVIVMEDQIVPSDRDAARLVRLVTFSCALPEPCAWFYVAAWQGSSADAGDMGLDGMNPARAHAMVDGARLVVGGASCNPRYASWFDEHRATSEELAWQRQAFEGLGEECRPLVSLIVPMAGEQTEYAALLQATMSSVRAQTYGAWELLLAHDDAVGADVRDVAQAAVVEDPRVRIVSAPTDVATGAVAEVAAMNAGIDAAIGTYVGLVGCGDVLEPDALWHVCAAIANDPKADVLYTDEDQLTGSVVHDPLFKTFPNYGKLYCHNYVGNLLVVSRWALERMGRPSEEVAAAFGYDLTLRAFEVARKKVHVPGVRYHRREEGSELAVVGTADAQGISARLAVHEAGRRALASHLARRGIAAQVLDGALPGTYHVLYELADPRPLVSIVIPTCDHADLLRACVTSILAKSTYDPFEVVLVENNSVEDRTFALYDELCEADERVRVVTWRPVGREGFNYSALVNFGVSQATGELLVLLNNDTEVIEPAWLEELAGQLMRPEVGVVGAKLLFKDGLIQHVGMAANPDAFLCHVCQNLTRDALGPGFAASMPGDYSMVTGACQMLRRSLFEQLGGYDEELAVGYNDADFCLRAIEAGWAVTVAAHAVLYHREFSSRGRESSDVRLKSRHMAERALFMRRHAAFLSQGDPALNPCLDPFGAYFNLR